MTWRDDLRPASFRGVAFEVEGSGSSGGRRGIHREYPGHDRGDIEDLGLADASISLTAHVIGDDALARRDALEAALDQPGSGILIHPTRGRLTVIVDPQRRWRSRESAREGRMIRFQMSFLRARDLPRYPAATPAREAAVTAAAADLRSLALARGETAMETTGPVWLREATGEELLGAVERLQEVSVVAGALEEAAPGATGLLSRVREALGTGRRWLGIALDVARTAKGILEGGWRGILRSFGNAALDGFLEAIGAADAVAALRSIYDIGEDIFTTARDGLRALISPKGAARAATLLLAHPARELPDPATVAPGALRAARTAHAIDRSVRLMAVSYLAEAQPLRRDFDGAEAAIEAMQALDAVIETEIRIEARAAAAPSVPGDAPRPAGDADRIMRALSDLRALAREAMLAGLADQRPVIRRTTVEARPSLALSWQLTGGIAIEADLLRRNDVAHPMFCPAGHIAYREEDNV